LDTKLISTNFSTVDWFIIILYPTISLGIGIFVRKFVKNMNDFVCAGKGLGTALGVATLTGTELGPLQNIRFFPYFRA
jgi:SSS family solute:Na+ symporter